MLDMSACNIVDVIYQWASEWCVSLDFALQQVDEESLE